MHLRPYQQAAFERVIEGFESFNKQLLVCPTGGGKTVIFSALAKHYADSGKRTLILAHRDELITQAVEKLHSATGIRADREQAEHYADDSPVIVGSIQTLCNPKRLERFKRDEFGLVVCDEAHHAISNSWQRVLNWFDGDASVLGVTATPDRGDAKELGSYFENIAYEIQLLELIKQGFLSPIKIKAIPLQIDVSSVGTSGGDFDRADLGHAIEPYLSAIAAEIKKHAANRKTLVFCPLIETSKLFVSKCVEMGLDARHVDGESPGRAEILEDFDAGKFHVLSNAMLLTEGYDCPSIDCVCVLRLTKSRALYSQMIGRGTRIDDFKSDLLVLDFLWLHETHSLVRPASLVAVNQREADEMTKLVFERAAGGGGEEDIETLAGTVREQREAKLKAELEANFGKASKIISADEFAVAAGEIAVAQYEPTMQWESEPPSESQLKALRRAKIDPKTVRGKGHARQLLNIFFARQKVMPASAKQRAIMRRMGAENWETATAIEARKFFAAIRNK